MLEAIPLATEPAHDDELDPSPPSASAETADHVAWVVEEIRRAPLDKLADAQWLEHEFLLSLGLNNENLWEFPTELYPHCGLGIRSWQYPSQFSRYLTFLRSQRIGRYAEIGCRHGGTFVITVEYLSRFHAVEQAVAVDPFHSAAMQRYAELNPKVRYINRYSTDAEAIQHLQSCRWDLVLIDGDHTFEGVANDYLIMRSHARVMAFHDIVNSMCPGVVRFWQMLRTTTPAAFCREFTAQYDEVLTRTGGSFLGLGLLLEGDPTQLGELVSFLNGAG